MKTFAFIIVIAVVIFSFPLHCSAWSEPSHRHITKAAFDVLPQWQRNIWDNDEVVFEPIWEANDTILDHLINNLCTAPDWHDGPTDDRKTTKDHMQISRQVSPFIYAERDGKYCQPIAYGDAKEVPWTFHYFDWAAGGPYDRIYRGAKWYFEKIIQALQEGKPLEAAQHFGCFAHGLEDSIAPYHCLDGIGDYRHSLWPHSNHREENFNFFISSDENANAEIKGYKPQMLGNTIEQAATEVAHRFVSANLYSRSLMHQYVKAHQKDDWKNRISGPETIKLQSLMASNNSKILADALYTSFCLAHPERPATQKP